jgi:hypothetical protein
MSITFLQILAVLIILALGSAFILVFSSKEEPNDFECEPVPASPAFVDYNKILNCIHACTGIDELRRCQEACDQFYDLHWKDINEDVRRLYYITMLKAISNKSKELYTEEVVA